MHSSWRACVARGVAGAGMALALIFGALAAESAARASSSDTYTFVSAPALHPPKLEVLEKKHGLAHGDLLAAVQRTSNNSHQTGPLIVDGKLQPVWFSNRSGVLAFQQETYEGHPVLVWAQGKPKPIGYEGVGHTGSLHTGPVGRETVIVVNEHYRRVARLNARSPWNIDAHDISIIGRDVWVLVDRLAKHRDLARYGGPKDGSVFDVGIQEYQLSTGRLLRTWDPLALGAKRGVPLSASKEPAGKQWDAYHTNSVQALPDGDVLVSMRNTWAVYLINPRTDHVIWTLGGKDSTFKVGKGAKFDWQHDAQLVDPGRGGRGSDVELTVFNNNSSRGPARGLILRLNTVTDKARLDAAYRHHPPLTSSVEGSMQVLSNGNALVNWGSPSAEFTEFSKSGRQRLDVRFPRGDDTYRTLLTDTWVGTPYYPPRGAVRGTTAYASWNGATQVAKWEVLAGSSAGDLRVVATRARAGFETAIKLAHTYALYKVRALSAAGRMLGTSKPFS